MSKVLKARVKSSPFRSGSFYAILFVKGFQI
ncbi:hypothetical protein SRA_02156 [Streptococcus ratti FA-1 = DSM 20564]|uniref:Uncharacterized protein n=1 Tax=Streptococcus ratti FA-1 = DSM 20564 TaxID=699248 RepID=A0ABP2QWC7_STRRT|nr:hypothetical protein SRA_02156 [Streptococcus ratti FA-1 = DSM 20564]